jgi:hypothetical protein
VALATVSGDVDLSTEQGRLVARMKGSVAAYEVEQIRKRLRRKHLQQAQKGVPWKSWKKCPPFGYTTEGTPDPAVAPLIKDAYAHILAGGSLGEVCRQLNAAGAYSRTWEYPKEANAQGRLVKVADSALAPVRRPWRACNMSRFLRAPHHAGLVCHQGQVLSDADGNPVKGNWEPIVDPDTWFTVQNILSAPERKPTPKTVRRHLLTGLLRCGKCEGRMRGWKGKAAKAGRYYCTECFGVTIMADLVESLILGDIADRLAAPDAVELLKVEDTDAGEAAAARAERAVLTARLDEIALERADGLLDSRAFHLMSERITNRLDTLTGREYAHSNVRALADLPLGSAKIAKAIEACSLSRQRAILEALCSRIVVAPVGRRGANRFDPDRVQIEWQS